MKKLIFVLACFPFLAFSSMVKFGDWAVDSKVDPITDKKTVMIMAVDTTKKRNNSAGLIFNCNSTSLTSMSLLDIPNKNQVGNKVKFILRVDKNKPFEMEWVTTEINYSYSNLDEINKLVENGNKLIIRAEYPKGTKDFTFSLLGFKKAYSQLKSHCEAIK
ncbi:hypothetical protein RHO12_03125 [Orbus sturtevantii]|uniref:hypothetical protein n=1 Tax=Orbus sturtevantii TaxID=3074109 RepID=UPI00370D7AEE